MGRHFSECAPVTLRLERSTQSGIKTMPDVVGTWLDCYIQSDNYPFIFAGAEIDLTNMIAGDTTTIEVHKVTVSGGAYVLEATLPYNGAQPVPLKHIGPVANVYGVRVRMNMTAGVAKSYYCEFYESLR